MKRTLALLLLLLVVAIPLRGALDVWFLQDDFNVSHVFLPEMTLNADTLYRLLHPPPDEKDSRLRPLSYFTILVDIALFGLDPFALHLTGLLFHLAAVAAVFSLARSLWPGSRAFAFLAALFFGLNPVHADAIGWLAARSDPVVGFFSLATLLAYLRYRLEGGNLPAMVCLTAYAAALFSKEAAVVTPGLALLMEPVIRKRCKPGGFLPAMAGLSALTGAYFLYRHHLFGVFTGAYGDRQATALAMSLQDAVAASLRFVAPAPGPLLPWILLLTPLGMILLFPVLGRSSLSHSMALKRAGLLLGASVCALLPVLSFLDQAHGRHFYLAAAPLALLVAGAATSILRRKLLLGLPALLAVLLYGSGEVIALRMKLAEYIQAGHITHAVRQDLCTLRAAHPDVKAFVVHDLLPIWKKAPLFFGSFEGVAAPPFQPRPVPVIGHFAPERRDLRWEAYHTIKPAVFLRLRTPPESPGLDPISPILRSAPPRHLAPGFACVSPAGGDRIQAGPTSTFRFRIPGKSPWPRRLRIVFQLPAAIAPLALDPENLREEAGDSSEFRTFCWQPNQGIADRILFPLMEGSLLHPVPVTWWIEETGREDFHVRSVASSPKASFVLIP